MKNEAKTRFSLPLTAVPSLAGRGRLAERTSTSVLLHSRKLIDLDHSVIATDRVHERPALPVMKNVETCPFCAIAFPCYRSPSVGSTGVSAFDVCSNLANGAVQSYGTYECVDNEVTSITYNDNDDCSGAGTATLVSPFDGSCTEGQMSSCTTDGEGDACHNKNSNEGWHLLAKTNADCDRVP